MVNNLDICHLSYATPRNAKLSRSYASKDSIGQNNMSVLLTLRKHNNTAQVSKTDSRERAQSLAQKLTQAKTMTPLLTTFNPSFTSIKETP